MGSEMCIRDRPRERHDKLYAASGNDRDGEPSLPMADMLDYQIINDGQEV